MKMLKVISVIMVAAFLTICSIDMSEAQTFHSGGVAYCDGCHSMHQPKAGGASLLQGIDPSSTCLICHEHAGDTGPSSYHISTAVADMGVGVPPNGPPVTCRSISPATRGGGWSRAAVSPASLAG